MIKKLQRIFTVHLVFLLLLSKGASAQTIRLDLPGTDLAKVVTALQQQAPSINFSYSQESLEKVRLDRVQVKAGRLQDALEILQKRYGLHYLMDGNNVTLKYVPVAAPPAPRATEGHRIEGTVSDENGQPLKGATVHVKGSGNTVPTDENGHYSIEAAAGCRLEISSVGFSTREVLVKDGSSLDVRLKEGANVLNEVVLVGYQKMRKSDFTGGVASVKAKELNVSAPTLGQALVGKVAGVVVSQTDGSPYASTKIRVRGVGSINAGSDPLYVIDGYPVGNDLYINPNDIESIDILKDAASAAIYGSRASGGVVLITTKRGKDGKGKLEYDFQYCVDQLAKKVKLLNGPPLPQLVVDGRNDSYRDLVQNAGLPWNDNMFKDDNTTRNAKIPGNAGSISIPTELYDFANGTVIPPKYNTDWQDALYRNAAFVRHNLSFSGGTKTIRYALSGAYQSQDGIMVNTGQQRVNFRANVDADISDKLKEVPNLSLPSNPHHEPHNAHQHHSPAFGALIYMPIFPVYNADGSLATNLAAAQSAAYGYQSIENPVATAERTQSTRKGNQNTYNAFASYELLSHLVFKANLGLQTYNEQYQYYLPSSLSAGIYPPFSPQAVAAAYATSMTKTMKDQLAEFTLNYNRQFGKHSLNLLGGYTVQKTDINVLNVTARGVQSDLIHHITSGAQGQVTVNTPATVA